MFLKKKQANSETSDVLQQIKEKISDTGNQNDSNSQADNDVKLQDVDNFGVNNSSDDDDLLNMLLSDENDDDEDDFNRLANKKNINDEEKEEVIAIKHQDEIENEESNLEDNHTANDDISVNNDDGLLDNLDKEYNDNDELDVGDDDEEEEEEEEDEDEDEEEEEESSNHIDDILSDINKSIANDVKQNKANDGANSNMVDEDDIGFYDDIDEDDTIEDDTDEMDLDDDNDEDDDEVIEDDIENNINKNNEQDLNYEEDEANSTDKTSIVNITDNDKQASGGISSHNEMQVLSRHNRQKSGKIVHDTHIATISDSTKKGVKKNISNLIEQVKRQVVDEGCGDIVRTSGSKTLEQIAVDLIQPVIIEYLNDNLERIVSDIVNNEIKRITDDIDR